MKAPQNFTNIIKQFEYQFDLRTVFNDFLSMSLCAVTQDPILKKSHCEDDYLSIIEKYKNSPLRMEFPKLFSSLILEMEERHDSSSGNDVLGEFYETHLYRKGASQYFTPPTICSFMAKSLGDPNKIDSEPLNILDPSCGSGRMLLSASQSMGKQNSFFGIDIDQSCVQMTALNLFLNGLFHSEVMWGDALLPDDFRMSYNISFMPLGVFRIEDKTNSKLWNMLQLSFTKKTTSENDDSFTEYISDFFKKDNSQLLLF